jgi:hypothetical protein
MLRNSGLGRTLILWCLTRAALVGMLALSAEHANFADVYTQYRWARGAWTFHVLPGRDFPWEYPPGAAPFLLLPVSRGGAASYFVEFLAETLAFDAALTLVLHRLGRARGSMTGLWMWLLLIPLLGPVVVTRFDVIPAAAVAVALAVAGGAPFAAAVLLTFGVTVKVWPALVLGLLLLTTHRPKAVLLASSLVTGLMIGASAATGLLPAAESTVSNEWQRGSQVESFAALPFLWVHAFGGPAHITYRHRAWEVTARGSADVALLFSVVGMCFIVWLAFLAWRASRRSGLSSLPLASASLVSVAMIGNKVLSPQYLLWLLAPLVVAACHPGIVSRWMLCLTTLSVGLTHAVYPLAYIRLLNGDVLPLVLVTARDAALFGLAVLLARDLMQRSATSSASAPPARRTAATPT